MESKDPEVEIQQYDVVRNAPAVGLFEQFTIIPNQPTGPIPEVHIVANGQTSHEVRLHNALPNGGPLVIPVQQSDANVTSVTIHVLHDTPFDGTWDQAQNPNYFACRALVEVRDDGTVVGIVTLRSLDPADEHLIDVQL